MDGFGRAIGDAIGASIAAFFGIAFVAGGVFVVACWALWHFLLAHLRVVWVS